MLHFWTFGRSDSPRLGGCDVWSLWVTQDQDWDIRPLRAGGGRSIWMVPPIFRGMYRIMTCYCSTGRSVSAELPVSGRGGTHNAMMPLLQKVNILRCAKTSLSISSVFGAIIIDPALWKLDCLASALITWQIYWLGKMTKEEECSTLIVLKPSVILKNICKAQQVKYATWPNLTLAN